MNTDYKDTSGWFRKIQNSDNISNFSTDRHAILRVKDIDDNNRLPGAIRYNEQESVFQGYVGTSGGGSSTGNWTNFNSTPGSNGLDGLNYRTVIEGNNLHNTGDTYYPLFKNVIKTEILDQDVDSNSTVSGSSQITTEIHTIPTFLLVRLVFNSNGL